MPQNAIFGLGLAMVIGLLSALYSKAADQQGDFERGKLAFKRSCKACHAVGSGARNGVGPQLNGIVGRKAASVAGFRYSTSMKEAGSQGLTWNETELQKYLEHPKSLIPKSNKAFAGIKDATSRQYIVFYLKTFSSK